MATWFEPVKILRELEAARGPVWRKALNVPETTWRTTWLRRLVRIFAGVAAAASVAVYALFRGWAGSLITLSLGAVLLVVGASVAVIMTIDVIAGIPATQKIIARRVTEDEVFGALEQAYIVRLAKVPVWALDRILTRQRRDRLRGWTFFTGCLSAPIAVAHFLAGSGLSLSALLGGLRHLDAGVFIAVGGPWLFILFASCRYAQLAQRNADVVRAAMIHVDTTMTENRSSSFGPANTAA